MIVRIVRPPSSMWRRDAAPLVGGRLVLYLCDTRLASYELYYDEYYYSLRVVTVWHWVWRHRGAGVTGNPPAWPTPLVGVSSLYARVGGVTLLH